MKTAVVILNWNTEEFLRKFLPALIDSVDKCGDACLIVADSASEDNSMKVMAEEFPDIRTIHLDRNYGFTGGYNRALTQIDAEYFVLINSDIEVNSDWLKPLVEWMDTHNECAACAPKLHSYFEKDMFEYAGAAGGFIDKFGYPFCRGRIMSRLEKDEGQYDRDAEVFWASGACLMVRSELYRRLGGLDERFFAHMEEIDLCWRLQLHGYKINIVPASTVYHLGGGTLSPASPFKLYLNFRNNLLMLENNLAKTYALRYYKSGMQAETAAKKSCSKSRRTIFIRMFMDGLSACVYLFSFRFKKFRSVCKAHGDYRRLCTRPSSADVSSYLKEYGDKAGVSGIYKRWIVLQNLLRRPIKAGNFLRF